MNKPEQKAEPSEGLRFENYFSTPDVHPFEEVEWEIRSAEIKDWKTGKVAFKQEDIEFPKTWSQRATDIVASKYFRGRQGSPQRERSVRQMIGRIVDTITKWGSESNYFASDKDAETFNHELTYLLVNQMLAFNSPVQFNVGIQEHPQCS
ncbi:MAG: vitamin B12-dependent ribonucleotide reductase, partial [Acidobacteriota bacterium]